MSFRKITHNIIIDAVKKKWLLECFLPAQLYNNIQIQFFITVTGKSICSLLGYVLFGHKIGYYLHVIQKYTQI